MSSSTFQLLRDISQVKSEGCEPMLMVWQFRQGAHHAVQKWHLTEVSSQVRQANDTLNMSRLGLHHIQTPH